MIRFFASAWASEAGNWSSSAFLWKPWFDSTSSCTKGRSPRTTPEAPPMPSAIPLLFLAVMAAVTWVSPLVSLYLFVLISPIGIGGELVGWDPRTRWAMLLCLRGAWEVFRTNVNYVPSTACKLWAGFTVVAVAGLWAGGRGLLADEMEASWTLLLYFIAGSCGVYGISQLVRKRHQIRALCMVFAASVLVVSSLGIL